MGKKITRVESGNTGTAATETKTFVASDESKAKAKKTA